MWTFQAHRLDVAAVISLMSPTLIKHQQAQYLTSALSSFSQTMGWCQPTYPDKPWACVGGVVVPRRRWYGWGMVGWEGAEANDGGVSRSQTTIRISRVRGTPSSASITGSVSPLWQDVLHPKGATSPRGATTVKDHACLHISQEVRRCCTPALQTTTCLVACRRAAGGR